MKNLTLTLAFAGLAAATAPLAAQGNGRNIDGVPPGQRPPAGMCRVWVNGVPPGRQAAPTDCATAQATAAAHGGRVIYGSDRGRRDCTYSQTRNSIGDVIFGRTGNANCESRNRVDNVWYEAGRDRDGNLIYERRRLDANGRLVVERARRDALGNFTIIGTRTSNSNDDKMWKKAQKEERKAMKRAHKDEHERLKSTLPREDYKDWKKGDKQEHKADKQEHKGNKGKGKGGH